MKGEKQVNQKHKIITSEKLSVHRAYPALLAAIFSASVFTTACGGAKQAYLLKQELETKPTVSIMYAGKFSRNNKEASLIDQFAIDKFSRKVTEHYQKEFPDVKFVLYKPTKKRQLASSYGALGTGLNTLQSSPYAKQSVKPKERSEDPVMYDKSDRPGSLQIDYNIDFKTKSYLNSKKSNPDGDTLECTNVLIGSSVYVYRLSPGKNFGHNYISRSPSGYLGKTYCEGDPLYSKNANGDYDLNFEEALKEVYKKYEDNLGPALKEITDKIKNAEAPK